MTCILFISDLIKTLNLDEDKNRVKVDAKKQWLGVKSEPGLSN